MSLAVDTIPTDLFIGGAWVTSTTQARVDVMDPSTETRITTVADASVDDALAAVVAASKAAPGWAATPPRERAEILRRAFELMTAQLDDLAELISRENGKALADAKAEVRLQRRSRSRPSRRRASRGRHGRGQSRACVRSRRAVWGCKRERPRPRRRT